MEERFDEIYNLYNKDVYRFIYSYMLNHFDTEDVLQKTFYKLYKNKKILKLSDIEIKKWLFRVSLNEAKDFFKSSWTRKAQELDEITSNKIYKNNENKLIEALKDIPKTYRIPLYLYYYEGYDIKEIAKILKKSESAIKMRLARGKEKLKIELEG